MTEHVRGPESGKPGLEDEHTRIADKRRFRAEPETEGVFDEDALDGKDVDDEALDKDPEDVSLNRRDVPPGDTVESRTEDD
jgi:hypothetical protein